MLPAKLKKFGSCLLVVSAIAGTSFAFPNVANAHWRGGHWHGGWGYYGAGLAAGALIGGLLASRYYYGLGPYYYTPGYYYDGPELDDAVAYCLQRFRSYDPRSETYLGFDGYRHPCP